MVFGLCLRTVLYDSIIISLLNLIRPQYPSFIAQKHTITWEILTIKIQYSWSLEGSLVQI